MKIGASVRYISSDDAFEVIVDLDPEQSLIEAIADTDISQHEAWDILDAWIVPQFDKVKAEAKQLLEEIRPFSGWALSSSDAIKLGNLVRSLIGE